MHLVWFRRDLRIKDNLALIKACESKGPVIAVFFETVEQWKNYSLSYLQADLICRRLNWLQDELAKCNIPLIVRRVDSYDDINASLAQLCHQYQITPVHGTKDYEIDEIRRDNSISGMLSLTQTKADFYDNKCIFSPGQILNKSDQCYRLFTPFKKAWLKAYKENPAPPLAKRVTVEISPATYTLLKQKKTIQFRYPTQASLDWPINDNAIIERLREFCRTSVADYAANRDYPSLSATSSLSPYLAIGALSPRQCLARLLISAPTCLDETQNGAAVWLSELIWREFYQHLLIFYPAISKGKSFQPWTDKITWVNNELVFKRWKQGRTGFPIVDAAMRQLNETGWMHNRLRMIAASFLVKDLHLDWRWGEQYFMTRLIDGDFAANNGGWQWSASVGVDAQPYFRIFNPTTQGKKFDPKGLFVRRWLKELDEVPDKYIHEPHLWVEKTNQTLTYPPPMIDHAVARVKALALFEKAKNDPCL